MKKVFRILVLMMIVFAVGGCNKPIESSNEIKKDYISVSNKNDVVYNLKNSINQIKNFSFNGIVSIKDKQYSIEGKIINGGTLYNSVVYINYENNSLYIKDGKVYVSYFYNGTNIIVKDTLDAFVEETIVSLENKGIRCDREKIYDIIKNKTLEDINFNAIADFVQINGGEYSIGYKNMSVLLDEHYLPSNFNFYNNDIKISVNFNYGKISIGIPIGYDLLTLTINDVKKILKIKCISDLIK